MNVMIKGFVLCVLTAGILNLSVLPSIAKNPDPPRAGKISGKSVCAGALSLLIWPGIGQAVNNDKGGKVVTHAALGLLPPYRFWSGYDALIDRKGGYWKGRI